MVTSERDAARPSREARGPVAKPPLQDSSVLSAKSVELLLRHAKLSKNLEEQWRADFAAAMQWDGHGSSIAVCPAS
jgi:hypothetical protein